MREDFQKDLREGHISDCPCCGRHAQMYRRKFHSSMALQLIRLYRLGNVKEYVHASKLILPNCTGIGDFSKAKYWGLIHPKDKADEGKANGYWLLTWEGEKFVTGKISIPKEVRVFDDHVVEVSAETITISDALGAKFDYQALMRGEA